MAGAIRTAEHERLAEAREKSVAWRRWGPYLSERQWGTVREDYSPDGSAWDYFPHDVARSRAYRWGEDGIAGISDRHATLCFALAPAARTIDLDRLPPIPLFSDLPKNAFVELLERMGGFKGRDQSYQPTECGHDGQRISTGGFDDAQDFRPAHPFGPDEGGRPDARAFQPISPPAARLLRQMTLRYIAGDNPGTLLAKAQYRLIQ